MWITVDNVDRKWIEHVVCAYCYNDRKGQETGKDQAALQAERSRLPGNVNFL